MTLFRMFVENGRRGGFWVQHRSWQNRCAQACLVGAEEPAPPGTVAIATAEVPTISASGGRLELTAYDVRSGRRIFADGQLPDDGHYTRIAEPAWSHPRPRHFLPRPRRQSDRSRG
jgi:hypothetical protein